MVERSRKAMEDTLVKLTVQGVMPDAIPNSDSQVVIMQDESKTHTLPIWVGVAEGTAIRLALEGVVPPRPLSHDLIRNLAEQLGLTISKVVVTDVKNNTYYASIFLRSKQEDTQSELTVDSRPSDAIALALRTSSPIYVTQEVLDHLAPENIDPWLKMLGSKEFGGTV
jgi:bifunctional DNase/RNase